MLTLLLGSSLHRSEDGLRQIHGCTGDLALGLTEQELELKGDALRALFTVFTRMNRG